MDTPPKLDGVSGVRNAAGHGALTAAKQKWLGARGATGAWNRQVAIAWYTGQ